MGDSRGLPLNAVVYRGVLDALGFSVLTLTRAISFCSFERTSFASSRLSDSVPNGGDWDYAVASSFVRWRTEQWEANPIACRCESAF